MQTDNKPHTNRVAIYVRVSTVYQVDKDSLPMQRQELLDYSRVMLHTEDCVIFEDAGYSGKNTDRPKYQEMMSQIRNHAFTHLLVWKIDRISRNLLDFASMYQELKDLGVVFVSKNEQFDTSTAMGEAMLKIILVFAELERNMTSERVHATMVSRASSGLWNGGRIPYGYSYDPETSIFSIIEKEAEVVRLIHDKYEEYRSQGMVTRHLNVNLIPTRSGALWNIIGVYKILTSVFYCGDYRYNVHKDANSGKKRDKSEWITYRDHHVPIISRDQKERILRILDDNSKVKYRSSPYGSLNKKIHVFNGLVFCGTCGRAMGGSPVGSKKSWQYSKYACYTLRQFKSGCRCKASSDPIIGEFTINFILNMLSAQKNIDSINSLPDLQSVLLNGDTFREIDFLNTDGLQDLYDFLHSPQIRSVLYGKAASKERKKKDASELSNLRKRRIASERALDRLTNLYLYDNTAISETEFISRKQKIMEQIEDLDEQIGLLNASSDEKLIDDISFIQRASEFIIAQKLSSRNYIYYKNLATSVDPGVLRDFFYGIIDGIIITSGRVTKIIFRNGLAFDFAYKTKAPEE